jgi:hypothetical protein
MELTLRTLPSSTSGLQAHLIGDETLLSNVITSALNHIGRTAIVTTVQTPAEAHELIDQGGQLSVIFCKKNEVPSYSLDPVTIDSSLECRYQEIVDMYW